jgi:hypothetical protein
MSDIESGLHKGVTSYGDSGFSLFVRKAFINGAGYTVDVLEPEPGTGQSSAASTDDRTVRRTILGPTAARCLIPRRTERQGSLPSTLIVNK